MSALGFEILFGSLTITGSLMAFGKLQDLITGTPITYKFQNVTNVAMFFATVAIFVYLIYDPAGRSGLFYLMLCVGLVIGVLIVHAHRRGRHARGVSLLNSYAGLSAAATGIRHQQQGAHHRRGLGRGLGLLPLHPHEPGDGPLVRQRPLRRRGQRQRQTAAQVEAKTVIRYTPEDAVQMLHDARSVIVVPGYGMAVAQAQHVVYELTELLSEQGVIVRYGIHPVAGRMPGT